MAFNFLINNQLQAVQGLHDLRSCFMHPEVKNIFKDFEEQYKCDIGFKNRFEPDGFLPRSEMYINGESTGIMLSQDIWLDLRTQLGNLARAEIETLYNSLIWNYLDGRPLNHLSI